MKPASPTNSLALTGSTFGYLIKVAILLSVSSISSLAETITVTTLADNAVTDGQVTLREALQAAYTDTSIDGSTAGNGTDTIVFSAALFSSGAQTLTLNGTQILLRGRVTIAGPGADQLTIQAGGTSRHFQVRRDGLNGQDSRPTIKGLTLTGGNAGTGGSIYVDDNQYFTAEDCLFTGNTATTAAAGYSGRYASILARRCQFTANTGGSILTGAGTSAQITIYSCSITNSPGHGITMSNGAFLSIYNSTISGSTNNGVNATWSTVTTIGSTISGNGGTGIANFGENMTLRNCTIVSNGGWGLSSGGTGTDGRQMTMHNTIVANNTTGEFTGLPLGGRFSNNIFGDPTPAKVQNIANGTRGCIVGDGSGGVLPLSSIDDLLGRKLVSFRVPGRVAGVTPSAAQVAARGAHEDRGHTGELAFTLDRVEYLADAHAEADWD